MLSSDEGSELVAAYCDRDDRDSFDDAWCALNDLVDRSPEDAWEVILQICDRAPLALVQYLGACQLEDLLARSAVEFRSRVIAAARTSQPFRQALSCVSFAAVPPDIVREIDLVLQEMGTPTILSDRVTYHPRKS